MKGLGKIFVTNILIFVGYNGINYAGIIKFVFLDTVEEIVTILRERKTKLDSIVPVPKWS